ncbi:MAG: GntR family transcriptional regulator [Gammaproteobacteria bacterium]|nr:GntR family transcriptional regulator [Gammaproteobacteria bacterium]
MTPVAASGALPSASPSETPPKMDNAPQYRPLYSQVYETLIKRIAGGEWKPGQALPSEQALAAQLGVSQGTVRKALDALALDKVIDRRQGKGTYVAELTQERSLFRFFRLTRPDGQRAVPTSGDEAVRQRRIRSHEARALELPETAEVFEIVRTRFVDEHPIAIERIVLPELYFPGLDRHSPLPNALYALYQREYGVNIVSTNEKLRADVARRDDARRLNVPLGTPLLQVERVALSVDGKRVEWRLSRCDTSTLVYDVTFT